jgi:hypothetical protein
MGFFDNLFRSPKQESTSSTQYPDWVNKAVQDIFSNASSTANKGFQPFGGQRVAPLSADTMKAGSLINGMKPLRLIDNIPGASGRAAGSIQDYMNPFMDGVMNPVLTRMREDEDVRRNQLDAEAVGAGAFGDARHGIEGASLSRDASGARSDMVNKIMAQAFESAMGLRNNDLNRMHGQNMDKINALFKFGGLKDDKAQARADFDFSEFMRKIGGNQQNLTWLTKLLGALPKETTTTGESGQSGGGAASLLGGLGSIIGAIL